MVTNKMMKYVSLISSRSSLKTKNRRIFSICSNNEQKITLNERNREKEKANDIRKSFGRSFDLPVMFTIDYSLDECRMCVCVCMHEQVI